MNFLAHIYLAGDNDELLLGNFIADAVKGSYFQGFNKRVKQGIILHRAIDNFTDKHPVFRQSTRRLHSRYHKYSGVIVDILYDHFLAKNWNTYSTTDLNGFAANAYKVLMLNFSILPPWIKRVLPFMMLQNWLVSYAKMDGLQAVFEGMARRTDFKSGMENVVADIEAAYGSYEEEFTLFFPEIIEYVSGVKLRLLSA